MTLGRIGLLLGALILLASGCSEELGPETMPTTRVSGHVRRGATPVRGGWIEFTPSDGTVGKLSVAPIGEDGSFDAPRVAVGRNTITIAHSPSLNHQVEGFFNTKRPIRRDIPDGPSRDMTIDLVEEAMRYRESYGPGR